MPDLPRLPAKVVRFHWEQVSHLDGTRRVPVVDVQVEILPGSLEVHRYTAIRSPIVGVVATETAQAFVDERRERVRNLFGGHS
jgi:hypothetical protein